MNIVNKLTIRHLKQNKRRTLVTIIGVIISVAMLTAVATIGVSFMDLLKRQTIAEGGNWHVLYHDLNEKQLEAVQKDPNTKEVILSKDRGYATLEGGKDPYKPYLFIKEYNEKGFAQFPIELSSGRYPQKANEVVISDEIKKGAGVDYKIGDVLKLDVGKRHALDEEINEPLDQSFSYMTDQNGKSEEKLVDLKTEEYTVVGTIKRPTWEQPWAPGYTILSYLDQEKMKEVNTSVVLKKLKGSLFADTEKFAKANKIEDQQYEFNYDLLNYSGIIKNGGMRTTLYTLSAIIMTIIIVGSVSLIYNAFAISVAERSRHLGMLSSVGATKTQKRNSVFFEGAVIGLTSIPIGIIAGLVGMGITFMFINKMIEGALGISEKLEVTVTFGSILVAVLVSILTIFISTFIPAKRASRISAIDAIRQTKDLKLTRKAVKTSKLVRKMFGMEAEIGLKNLKRNKRRYQATVFSLVISIILFLSVSFFTDNLKKSLELSQVGGADYDIYIELGHEGDDQFVQSIVSMDDVTEYNIIKDVPDKSITSWVDKDMAGDQLQTTADFKEQFKDGKYQYYINLYALNDESLKSYADQVGANYEQLQNSLSAIAINTIQYEDEEAGRYVETKNIHAKVGDKLSLNTEDWETEKEEKLDQITIAALTDQKPMGVFDNGGIINVVLIVSESTLNQLGDGVLVEEENSPSLYLKSKDPIDTQKQIEEIENIRHYVENYYKDRQDNQQMILLMSVFTYGFITLITLISIANILNTISTSISLRKREFAMLKSMGMTPKGFNKMINYESIFYGLKALLYGLPISIAIMYLMYRALMNSFSYAFTLPWLSLLYVVVAVFLIVGIAMLYSSSKVKKENIIDALKQENI